MRELHDDTLVPNCVETTLKAYNHFSLSSYAQYNLTELGLIAGRSRASHRLLAPGCHTNSSLPLDPRPSFRRCNHPMPKQYIDMTG